MPELARLAHTMLGGVAAVVASDPQAPAGGLFPVEAAAAEAMAERRRREFAAGRRAARAAMREFGFVPVAIPIGADRVPGWPDGLIGSISHSATWCLVGLALRGPLVAFGLDLEPDEDLPEPLWETVLTADERRRLAALPRERPGRLAKLIFSAKEAVYKCQHPLTGALLDFQDVEIALDVERRAFSCAFRTPALAVGPIEGRFAFAEGHALTTASICGSGASVLAPTWRGIAGVVNSPRGSRTIIGSGRSLPAARGAG